MIPMPNINIPDVEIPEVKIKSNYIIRMLIDYGASDARDAIRIIEERGVDKFRFNYPYNSFEEYKKHVLSGEFDVESKMITQKRREKLRKAVENGKLSITY